MKCPVCGGTIHRVPEVIDCWFDSGAMPFAQHHYPFENQELFKQQFPANFISEAVDQTRGWFYSLLAESTLLFNQAPYKNVIVLGHVQDENGQKMSKSKGEFLTVSLLEEKGYDPLAYRFFCLQSHYRKALVFSWENLDNAAAAYGKLIAKIAALNPEDGAVDEAVLKEYKEKFLQQMGNDLNTSMGVTALYDALKAKTNDPTKLAILDSYDQVLSLSLLEKAAAVREANAKAQTAKAEGGYTVTGEGDPAIDALVMQRYEAKKSKNFAEADRIRDELKAQGIEIVDTKDGANWKRV